MKSVFAALAAVTLLPGLAMAQTTAPATAPATGPATGAAATLPNTFDQPAAARQAPAETAVPAPVVTPSDPAKVAAAEAMLRKTVAAMQSGTPNYGDMTADLAAKVREQALTVLPLFAQLGALQTVAHVKTEDGAELFTAVFANAPTQWIIAQNADGKLTALLFRPAPPPGAAATQPGA